MSAAQIDTNVLQETNKNGGTEIINIDEPNATDICMSRGMRQDARIEWEQLDQQFVFDEMGNKIRFTDIFKKQKTIVLFIRVSFSFPSI